MIVAELFGSNSRNTLTALDAPACLLPNGKVVCFGGTTEPVPGDYPADGLHAADRSSGVSLGVPGGSALAP